MLDQAMSGKLVNKRSGLFVLRPEKFRSLFAGDRPPGDNPPQEAPQAPRKRLKHGHGQRRKFVQFPQFLNDLFYQN